MIQPQVSVVLDSQANKRAGLQALKTFPSTTPERWERIAESIPGRGKKDCMKRLVIL